MIGGKFFFSAFEGTHARARFLIILGQDLRRKKMSAKKSE